MTSLKTQASCDDSNEKGTITVSEAQQNILSAITSIGGLEKIHILQAVGRVLAETIISPINVPSHCNSAVDGYAISQNDLAGGDETKELKVITKVVAGHPFEGTLKSGQAIQIMTGAQMPANCDTVIMQEHVERHGDVIRIDGRHKAGQNVRQAGEDIQQGTTTLEPGAKLTPPQIGLIASLGFTEITVKVPLRVTVFSTGDEILNIGEAPREGCIYDSNRYSLIAALKKLGCHVTDMGIIADEPRQLKKAFLLASKTADVILTSGGVSVGDADYTKQVLSETGEMNFWKVAMKPGRPMAFGKIGGATFFGLPGNPVAVMVTFYQFALPALQKMTGANQPLVSPLISARCTSPIRKLPGRAEFQRGVLSQNEQGVWQVCTTGQQGSGVLRSMSEANAFIILEHEQTSVKEGEWVNTQPFSGLF
ncbi:MAG: molybdopterin molybdenumtransferase MoeA [Cycloclasticus sp. symbiont of Poecilosclerida sp. M]|nr:MAG: molybdopterin molybdenumtransferase MoeA [Cycloclasticus sp. symbiont of Poecilosclerida sp. M]